MDFEIRESRKEQGSRKLQREREEYFRLLQLGFGNLAGPQPAPRTNLTAHQ